MKHRFNYISFLSTFFLFVYLFPRNADAFGKLIVIQNILEVLGFVWVTYILVRSRNIKLKKYMPMLLFILWTYPCTIINGGTIASLTEWALRMISTIILSEYLIIGDSKRFIKNISSYWTILMCLEFYSAVTNIFGEVVVQNNMGRTSPLYLFGMKVEIDQYLLYAITFNFLAVILGGAKQKVFWLLTFISTVAFSWMTEASTAIMGILLFYMILFLGKIARNKQIWKQIVIIVVFFAILFGFVGNTTFFEWLVEGILHEGITMNGRTILWSETIKLIHGNHLIFGYGMSPGYIIRLNDYFSVNHPHNQYLQCLFYCGVPGLLMYIWLLVKEIRLIAYIQERKIRMVYTAAIISNMIISIVSRNLFYGTAQVFFVIAMHIIDIDKLCDERVKRIQTTKVN